VKILITGGAGFIGSHLCDKYINDHHTVLCLDNFENGSLINIRHLLDKRNFKLITGDIRNFDLLEKITRDVDAIFHLAAQIHVDRSIVEPKMTYDINVLGTQNVLEVARMADVDKVIHASTSEVYGTALYAPMDESHPLNAPHPYGASKIAADRMCHAYNETYGMNICVMRSFNLFGPRQKDTGYGGVISLFANRVLNNMPPIVYGNGEQTRDYTEVTDIVSAYDLILKSNRKFDTSINFGTGVDIKIIDLANMIIKILGKDLRPVHVEPRPGEVQRLIADNSKAKALGWVPKIGFEEGLIKFLDWYKNYRPGEWTRPGVPS
jgi:UDP-glucose 4-epimerase